MSTKRLETGDEYRLEFSYSQEDVNQFARVTGDDNALHLDEEFAKNTIFKSPIMHGFLGGSVFSKIFGTLFPGEGTIYMSQSLRFIRPMFVNTTYEALVKVIEVDKEKNRAKIETQVIDANTQKVTIDGEAMLMNPERI